MAVSTQYDHVALPGAELLDDPMDSSWPKAPAKGRPRPSARPPSGTAPHQCCPSRIAALEPARDVDLAFPSPCSELPLRSGPGFNPIHGAVVGHTALVGPYQQIAILPFMVLDATGPVAWEVHRIVRIGTFLERIDPWRELAPLGHALALRRIHIYEVPSTSSRALREHMTELDLLVVVGGEGSDEVVSRLPVPGRTAVADLSRDVPWQELFSRDLAPLDAWYPDPAGAQSTFRLCALMGLVLELAPVARDANRPIDYLVSKYVAGAHRSVLSAEIDHVRV